MAEQLIDRRSTSLPTGFPAGLVETSPQMGANQSASTDALRQAKTCLDSAGRRLRKGEPENADEALNLLWAAADHLRQAMTASVDVRISSE
jgi:hypothetical protein